MHPRISSGELSMSLAEFKASDFGQLCQHLGLRPSQPHANAQGKDTRRSRPRRRRKTPVNH